MKKIVAVSAALFFLSGCSADSSIAGASEEESNCDMYGRLYTHADAANACPEGWALPTMIQSMAVVHGQR